MPKNVRLPRTDINRIALETNEMQLPGTALLLTTELPLLDTAGLKNFIDPHPPSRKFNNLQSIGAG
jgi:hypothetical protein